MQAEEAYLAGRLVVLVDPNGLLIQSFAASNVSCLQLTVLPLTHRAASHSLCCLSLTVLPLTHCAASQYGRSGYVQHGQDMSISLAAGSHTCTLTVQGKSVTGTKEVITRCC